MRKYEFGKMSNLGVHEKVLEIVKQYIKNSKLLVTGSGEGSLEYKLLELGVNPKNIISLDINPDRFVLDEIEVLYCDLNKKIPLPNESFDICFSTEVIEHLNNPSNLIFESYRILKTNGFFILTTPNVHSYMQKIRYLFTDQFDYFADSDFNESGHIHPIFDWWLKRVIKDKFSIINYTSQSFYIRLLPRFPKIPVPFKNRFFAVNNIYLLKKNEMRFSNKTKDEVDVSCYFIIHFISYSLKYIYQ